jgi:SAM-dependent methyltransferase
MDAEIAMQPQLKSNFVAARDFVAFGLEEKRAGRRESASGPGSSLAAAASTIRMLRRVLAEREIRSILDLGCGDWNWMRTLGLPHLNQGKDVRYLGWEANADLVAALESDFGQTGRIEFQLQDITTAAFPPADLIIARDVLFHLPIHLGRCVIDKIRSSCRFLLSTSFLNEPQNSDIQSYLPIENWGFYPINLNVSPYDLGSSLEEAAYEPLCDYKGKRRYVCLYAFQR